MAFDITKNNEVVGANFFFKLSILTAQIQSMKKFLPPSTQNILIEQGLDFIFLIKIIELILYNVYMRASLYNKE